MFYISLISIYLAGFIQINVERVENELCNRVKSRQENISNRVRASIIDVCYIPFIIGIIMG